MNIFLLFVGLFFSMFFVGFIVVETFFPNIRVIFKYPLYILISVLISTWSVYFFSLLFGFSTKSIIFVFCSRKKTLFGTFVVYCRFHFVFY